jgi:D-amino-acid dehydrogenase
LSEARVTVTPIGDRVRIAGTLELCGTDLSINRNRVRGILDALPRYFESFNPVTAQTTPVWSGLRPCTPDGLPILGRSKVYQNVYVATGHAMIGMTLAPISGLLMTELISGSTPSIDLKPFRIERFQKR